MTESIVQIANSRGVWLVAVFVVSFVVLQAVLFTRLAFKSADEIGFPREKCMQGFKSGMISAIGPSVAVVIVMVGMMSVLGGPITWLRLSMIGSAATEMLAAKTSANALGIPFDPNSFDGIALANAYWAMAVNGIGWLLVVVLFTNRMEDIRQKIGGGDSKWLALVGLSASLGAFAYINSDHLFKSFLKLYQKAPTASWGAIGATVGGMFGMILFQYLSKKYTWLRECALGLAMLLGMGLAMVLS